LDDGRLTDGQGRTVDFKNTVIIMTSNAGSELWMNGDQVVSREAINRVLQLTFKPEFLNRLDEIVVFHSLTLDDLKKIVELQLQHVRNLLSQRGFLLEIEPDASAFLVEAGTDIEYGAGAGNPVRQLCAGRYDSGKASA
jgi:ATP-dependent Clp protease ATP-binding subunit ClpB